MNILDAYIKTAPAKQNAVELFKDEWASKFPSSELLAGSIPLFEDNRMMWAIEQFGGVQNKHVLELGPLEAGHTYMMEKDGAASITAIEANSRAYLKCLIVKEIFELQKSRFLLGDCIEYLRTCTEKFDVCLASGILYHMVNPVEMIALLARVTDKVYIWTHYYDGAILLSQPNLSPKYTSQTEFEHEGFQHILYRQEYKAALDDDGFCGGSDTFSNWISRADILAALKHFGFTKTAINFEQPDHPNGPCFALVATK